MDPRSDGHVCRRYGDRKAKGCGTAVAQYCMLPRAFYTGFGGKTVGRPVQRPVLQRQRVRHRSVEWHEHRIVGSLGRLVKRGFGRQVRVCGYHMGMQVYYSVIRAKTPCRPRSAESHRLVISAWTTPSTRAGLKAATAAYTDDNGPLSPGPRG